MPHRRAAGSGSLRCPSPRRGSLPCRSWSTACRGSSGCGCRAGGCRWRSPLFVFLTSWLAMSLVEPADSDIADPGTYWWYFLVTSATVGYGDVFPVSPAGRIVGLYVIVGGIVTLTLLFTQLATALQSIRGRRLRGVVPLDLSDHVVLLGYWPGRTERIVAELTAESRFQVALCAWDDVAENPLPDHPAVHFVRGDLTHEDVMTRACVSAGADGGHRRPRRQRDARDRGRRRPRQPRHPPGRRASATWAGGRTCATSTRACRPSSGTCPSCSPRRPPTRASPRSTTTS